MDCFKNIFNKNKVKSKIRKFRRTINKYKKYILENLVDILVVIAMLIIGINSSTLNLHLGMYIVSLELIIVAYFISKKSSNNT